MAQGNGGIIGKRNTPTVDVAGGVWTKRDMELAQQAGIWPQTVYQYQIARSLRFNKDDSAYLNRNAATITNRNIWTYSGWIKRTNLSDFQYSFFGATYDANSYDEFRFTTADKFRFFVVGGGAIALDLITTQVFRDPSAWYHIVVAFDSTQATASNRAKLYVNGTQVTAFDTATYPSQNYGPVINFSPQHIGNSPSGFKLNCYLTDVHFIDGQALTPSFFGENNADTGVWQPKAYVGTYGTNGFKLNFSDNSGATATTLGKDSSPNGNNWTPNNFSVSAGAGNDSLVDSPTSYGTDTGVGGTVRGNYCTWNPLDKNSSISTLNGNLDAYAASGSWFSVRATFGMSSGKWYWETVKTSTSMLTGIGTQSASLNTYVGGNASGWSYFQDGNKFNNDVVTAYGSGFNDGDVIGVAFDADNGTLTFYKNGTSQGTAFTGLTSGPYFPMVGMGNAGTVTANFGQRPFAYTAPSGFKALCTQNLAVPAVGATAGNRGGNHYNAIAFTGDGVVPRAMTGFGFSPDLLWSTRRDVSYGIQIFDSVRGAGKRLNLGYSSLSTAAEDSGYGLVNSFDADGYTSTTVDGGSNNNGASYLTWGWNAGESTVSNTAGSITSSVRANPAAGISVLTYTASGSVATIGHGLGGAPSVVILRGRSSGTDWFTYHAAMGATQGAYLNQSLAAITSANFWNNTVPTSTVFTAGVGVGGSGVTMVAHCFAEVAGFSKFGSYVGNGSTNGPFVFTGFRPAYLLVKCSSNSGTNWIVYDTTRDTYNVAGKELLPNSAIPEATYPILDFLSNGFKLRIDAASVNGSGYTYIFMAFASSPFKYSLAR